MCGPDHEPPEQRYVTHESLVALLEGGEYVQETFPVSFRTADGKPYTFKSSIAYRKGAEPKPLVMVFPNYAGLKQFDKDQALFLARLGYVGLAVDLYPEVEGYRYEDRNPVVDRSNGEKPAHGDYVNMQDAKIMEAFMKLSDPAYDPVANPITVAQTQGMAHFKAAFAHYHGCLKAKAHWRELMALNLSQAKAHPAVHDDLAAAMPAVAKAMGERLDFLAKTFFENSDNASDACPRGAVPPGVPCACWMAVHKYGGTMGPFQEITV